MADTLRHPGAVLGLARFFHDPRGSMRGVLDSRPREGRLFAYALGAVVVLLAGRVLALLAAADALGTELPARIAAHAAALLFFVPLAWYGLAALGTLVARAFGGTGGWRDGRAAFFWAALVSAPVVALSTLAPVTIAGAPPEVLALVTQIGPLFFAWALAQCYAEAFGFRRAWAVLAVIAGIALGLSAIAWGALI